MAFSITINLVAIGAQGMGAKAVVDYRSLAKTSTAVRKKSAAKYEFGRLLVRWVAWQAVVAASEQA
ncbi:hypothetical protein [Comamonas sp. 4034]|uniref:hypothetical protein n=1 Tax=Comamonas sp. 4034 TaxID=3156455 RepID=UPI003D21DB2A